MKYDIKGEVLSEETITYIPKRKNRKRQVILVASALTLAVFGGNALRNHLTNDENEEPQED